MPGTLPPEAGAFVESPDDSDVTFVDAESVVRFYSEYRIFSRPESCLDADVMLCHSAESRPRIERMLAEFRDGRRENAVFLSQKSGRDADVVYSAVRGADGGYLGCVEVARWAERASS